MQKHWNMRRRQWAVVALGASVLAGCTTYKPLDGGSHVPWAQSQVQGQAAPRQLSQAAPVSRSVVASELPPLESRRAPVRLEAPRPTMAQSPAPAVEPVVAPRAQPTEPVVAAAPRAAAPDVAAGQATQHRVAAGDRLGAVAQAYGVSLEALARVNAPAIAAFAAGSERRFITALWCRGSISA